MVNRLKQIVERLALLAGFGLVVAGVQQMHPPTAMIVAGLMLIAGVLWRRPWAV